MSAVALCAQLLAWDVCYADLPAIRCGCVNDRFRSQECSWPKLVISVLDMACGRYSVIAVEADIK